MADHHSEWNRLGDGSLLTEDAAIGLGHVLPFGIYAKTLGALLVLTFVTVGASRVDFGAWNAIVALSIASLKAGLVAVFFMHLKFERKMIIGFVVYTLILLALLIGGSFMDVAEREIPTPEVGNGQ